MPKKVVCGYCGQVAKRVGGDVIYPHRPDLHSKLFYACAPCDARVGCHPATGEPLGTLANRPLRMARMSAHASLDGLWKPKLDGTAPDMTRTEAYEWLSLQLRLEPEECHIGRFTEKQCAQVMLAVDAYRVGEDIPF